MTLSHTGKNDRMNRYLCGILLTLFTVAGWPQIVFAQESFTVQTVPNPKTANNTWVSDPSGQLSDSDLNRINTLINQVEAETTTEVAVVVLPSIGSEVPKDFAVDLFKHWGIGKKDKDNGLLLLIVLDQRRWEFESGYGLEGDLPDITLKRIGESELVPGLRSNKMGDGIYNSIKVVAEKLGVAIGINVATEAGGVGGNVSTYKRSIPTDRIADDYMDTQYNTSTHSIADWLTGIGFGVIALVSALKFRKEKNAILKSNEKGLASEDPRTIRKTKELIDTSRWQWLKKATFWSLIPIGIAIRGFFNSFESYLIFVYVVIGFAIVANWAIKARQALSESNEPYSKYKNLREISGGWFIASVIFFPLPMLFFVLFNIIKLKQLRYTPRYCPNCAAKQRLLDEGDDDFFLSKGQVKEEQLGSVDYDVWLCDSCQKIQVFAYDAMMTSYSSCSSCSYKTYHMTSDRTIISPTCTSSGSGQRNYKCELCGYADSQSYTIPARDCTS